MDFITSFHSVFAWVLIGSAALAGSWATAAHWVEPLRGRPMWVAQHTMHAMVVLQVVLGSIVVGFGGVEADQTHMFYGFLTFVGVGLIIGYRQLSEYKYLLYGLGGLFIMGLAIRAALLDPLAA